MLNRAKVCDEAQRDVAHLASQFIHQTLVLQGSVEGWVGLCPSSQPAGERDPARCPPVLPFGCSARCRSGVVGALRVLWGDGERKGQKSPALPIIWWGCTWIGTATLQVLPTQSIAGTSAAQQTSCTQGTYLEYLATAKYLIMQGRIPLRLRCLGFIKEAAEIIALSPWAL